MVWNDFTLKIVSVVLGTVQAGHDIVGYILESEEKSSHKEIIHNKTGREQCRSVGTVVTTLVKSHAGVRSKKGTKFRIYKQVCIITCMWSKCLHSLGNVCM